MILPQATTGAVTGAVRDILAHAGKAVVVKFGGGTMGQGKTLPACFAEDMLALKRVGINLVMVHGGRRWIDAALREHQQLAGEYVKGLRVTANQATLAVVVRTLRELNGRIVGELNQAAKRLQLSHSGALGLLGCDGNPQLLVAERIPELGLTGYLVQVNPAILRLFESSTTVPAIIPLASDVSGQVLNVNADEAAGGIASSIRANRLLLLTETQGVLDRNGQLIPELSIKQALELMEDGTITQGMIPKVKTCIKAVQKGVGAAAIIDGRVERPLLLELLTEHGCGTIIRNG